jgi:Flp pilus assembly protein TadD
MKQGNTGRAIGELREAAALSPELLEAHYQLGLALGRSAEAESAFRRVLQLNPSHASAHYQLGLALASRGDHTAASEFKLAVELAPGLTEAHRALAKLATTAKDWTTAEAQWTAVLAWIPDDPDAHVNLPVVLKARSPAQ